MRKRRRAFRLHPKCHETVRASVLFRLHQHIAADELRLVQINEERKPRLDRIVFGRKIGPVERIAHFESKRVARAETARPDSEVLSRVQKVVPGFRRVFGGTKYFDSILAGITGAGYGDLRSITVEFPDLVARRQLRVLSEKCL